MDKYSRLILALTNEFKNIHEDSQYVYPSRRGAIDNTLVFDIRLGTSNSSHRQNAVIEVSLFNTGTPARTFRLIDKIERHFTDRLIHIDGSILKFDRYKPISDQQRVDAPEGLLRIDLTMDAVYYPNNENQPENMQHSNY